MVRKEEVQPDNGRVTAGIPSLDSPKRFQHDSSFVSADYQQKIEADIEGKREQAVAPDGERSTTQEEACDGSDIKPAMLISKLAKLSGNLWFERSIAAPSQMGVYLRVPVSVDQPEGLQYVCGFPADAPVREFNFNCTQERWTHTRLGVMQKVIEPCGKRSCKRCGGLKHIPGWRKLLFRLMELRVITQAQADKEFGSCTQSKNWQRAISGT